MLKLALELITLDTYLKEIRAFVKVESMKCFILTLESTIVTIVTLFVEFWILKLLINSPHLLGREVEAAGSYQDDNR